MIQRPWLNAVRDASGDADATPKQEYIFMTSAATQPASDTGESAPGATLLHFPLGAGILLGLGLGGFFDGIVLHQILQWHHMLSSAGFPADNVHDLKINTLADGLFHASTYIFVVWGLFWLWRAARRPHFLWSAPLLLASMLMGFGIFNVVEGVVDHHLLGIHHVNETVPQDQWIYWDLGFLVWGLAMLAGGWLWVHRHRASGLPGVAASAPRGAQAVATRGAVLEPGDEAPEGTAGTGEAICRECGGTGRNANGLCPSCGGDGRVTVALAGG
jgi:uncharacterized membrane protein